MRQIVVPGTDLKVSRFGLGTASLHHLVSSKEREFLLKTAVENGFTHFDTARLYGEGLAERNVGQFLKTERDKITIATKFGIPANPILEKLPALMYGQKVIKGIQGKFLSFSESITTSRRVSLTASNVEASLLSSLKALQTDWIDIFFVHEPQLSDVPSLLELADWLQDQKKRGLVRYLGLAGTVQNCMKVARHTGQLFDILQVEDSLKCCEADKLVEAHLPIQISFGYLRRAALENPELDSLTILSRAMFRNKGGMILVSSRKPKRLKDIALIGEYERGRN